MSLRVETPTGNFEIPAFENRCPVCQRDGLESKLRDFGSIATSRGSFPYYDEAGVYHHHSMNQYSTYYECSNGHQFSLFYHPKCPCGWVRKAPWITVFGPKSAG